MDINELIELERKTNVERNSYIVSYPHIAAYFSKIERIEVQDFILGSHMVYSWMPTVLTLHLPQSNPNKCLANIVSILNIAKHNGRLSVSDIKSLAKVINNSVVGTSKLLHFIDPKEFAIWDSKIYSVLYQKKPYSYRVNNPEFYLNYLNKMKSIIEETGFKALHNNVNAKVGYEVSAMRAIELIIFLNSKEG